MRWIADLCYLLAGLLYLPVALYNALIVGKNRHGWGERFGMVRAFAPPKPRIWVHAVSLGEINCTPRLAEELHRRLPDHEIVFSTTTDTGFARAVQLYGRDHVFRFPLDFSPVIARTLRRVDPSLILLIELEVWYNLISMAAQRGIPVAVVNGRLTTQSARRFRRLGGLLRPMFRKLTWVGAQDEAIAARFRALGVPDDRVDVTSSLKWDSAVIADQIDGDRRRELLHGWPTLAHGVQGDLAKGGGVGSPMLAIVPRKPERFDEVARVIEHAGFACVRRSSHADGRDAPETPESAVFLGDTMGELRKFYSLADVSFVGRSLVPMGGSDPMEVAALGKPIVVGPHTENFQLPVTVLATADAIRIVESPRDLASVVGAILGGTSLGSALGARAREVVIRNQGATQRTADRVVSLLDVPRP